MAVELMPLPYPTNALEPTISARTLEFHHGKHHKAYVAKTNELVAGTPLEGSTLNSIVLNALAGKDAALRNQAGQAWNHGFYWMSLSPDGGEPSVQLATAIQQSFGSRDNLAHQLVEAAAAHFASGWAWLLADGAKLSIETTHDAGCPIDGPARPLLVIDVWEHAYYLDHQNDRKAYLQAVVGNLLNWDFASANFARDGLWTYPSPL